MELVNSSWNKLIEESKTNGLAFVGSAFNKEFEDLEQGFIDNQQTEYYADRKYNKGKSFIRFHKLDKNGTVIGSSGTDRTGDVKEFGRFFVVINKAQRNIMAYAKV